MHLLVVCRNAEKIFWYTARICDEFKNRGFTTEVRQFANELVTASQIWGLQVPFLVGKTHQVLALHMEDNTKLWQKEATELAAALRLDGEFARDIDPTAKAEAIVMETVRRSSQDY